jgi:1,4-alpha-glucan branching enzyme
MFGVPRAGIYEEIFNSNYQEFGGDVSKLQTIKASKKEVHGRAYSISVNLSPLSVSYFIKK